MLPLRSARAAPFAAAALLWLAAGAPAAHAQGAPAANLPAANTAWQSGYLFDFSTFGPESGLGQAMADAGVYLNGGEIGILAGNVAGGAKQGAVFNNDFNLEVDLDMARIAGIPGASMPIVIDDRVGGYYGRFSGSNTLRRSSAAALWRQSIYAMFQQMIWRPDLSEIRRGLTIFGGAMFGANQSDIRQYYQTGLSDQGPFAAHPHDSINFLAMYQVFNQRLIEDQTMLANLGGNAGGMNKGETDFELNYLWQVGAGAGRRRRHDAAFRRIHHPSRPDRLCHPRSAPAEFDHARHANRDRDSGFARPAGFRPQDLIISRGANP